MSAVPVAVLNSKGYECIKLQICKLSLQVLSKPDIMAILRAWLDRNPSGSSGEHDTKMFTVAEGQKWIPPTSANPIATAGNTQKLVIDYLDIIASFGGD